MEFPQIVFDNCDYIAEENGNLISSKAILLGKQNIAINGKGILYSKSLIRGDRANMQIGRYFIFGQESVLNPSFKENLFFPSQIGDHVYIGANSVVNAEFVGSYVYIGNNVVIGRKCVLKDCCVIADNAVLAPETTVPSYKRFVGSPATCEELPEFTQDSMINFTRSYYEHFAAVANFV